MSLSFEALLMLGIVAFYIYDSVKLLYSDDLLLLRSHKTWSFAFPGAQWNLRNKLLYIPNPFKPANLIFQTSIARNEHTASIEEVEILYRYICALEPIRYLVLILFGLMCVCLPMVVFRFGTGTWFFVTVILIYITILSALVYVYFKRYELNISNKEFIALTFDVVACPPFSMNLLRKISLRYKIQFDPVAFASESFDKDRFNSLLISIKTRLEEKLELLDEGSEKSIELKAYIEKLSEMTK